MNATSRQDDTGWVAAHVFCDDNPGRLAVDVLPGLVAELRESGLAQEFFFLRYWDGGKHMRFRFRPGGPGDAPAVRDLVEKRCRDYLAAHPAPDLLDEAEYEALAPTLAASEKATSYLPRQRNNSVVFMPYHREHGRYGYGAAMAAAEEHFAESSETALNLLTRGLSVEERFTGGFSALVLAWLCCGDDPGWQTSWATADGQSARVADEVNGAYASDPDTAYQRQRETLVALTAQLRALAERTTATPAPPDPASGSLIALANSFVKLRNTLRREADAGRFVPPPRYWDGATEPEPDTETGVLPVLDICAHLFCNRIGLSMRHESYIRMLAMRAVNETAPQS
ncbi:thiopeptide-type bacteriocin biosynthesis protein [Lipingzhangella halophila]|uniref:Thiopeptide-type bacteriocin biosynthesis protein n=1 Tax=Lipingzhangella halophila TaxID=1783352 RepID=A0A7W7RK60_9ACTN|nr:lantibiotic dehydratase C-terminal domain-containing protein [Lipingzhangella halophila]MBB4933459.1 thiopeptide-type bacteriocin biosynthesis protein [Lipingzhangella halophila]